MEPKIGYEYLIGRKSRPGTVRIATFNGFGTNKGWGGMDWAGDTGHSTDSWMHDDVIWFFPVEKLYIEFDAETKEVTNIGVNQL